MSVLPHISFPPPTRINPPYFPDIGDAHVRRWKQLRAYDAADLRLAAATKEIIERYRRPYQNFEWRE